MLQTPDRHTNRILKLADRLEHLSSDEDFDMRNWCCCIAGYAVRMEGHDPAVMNVREEAKAILGLLDSQAKQLFSPRKPNTACWEPDSIRNDITPRQAASCLRHFAITGVIDWKRATKELEVA